MSFETPLYPGIDLNENQGPTLVAVGIIFTVLTGVTVILRFIARRASRISIEKDDWLLLASAIFACAYNAVIMVEAERNYYGQHIHKSNPYHLEEFLKGLYSLAVVYPVALTLSKLSLLALYWRIFSNSAVKRPIQIAVLLNICWTIAAILVGLFSCRPLRGFWDLSVHATCIQEYNFFLTNECLTIALDLVVLFIPFFAIAQIQRSVAERISIGSTFVLGLAATAVSAVRLWQLVLAQRRPGFDVTFNQTPAALWAIVEINVWIIVASIPALRPLVYDLFKRTRALSTRQNTSRTVPSDTEKRTESKGSDGTRQFWFENAHWNSQESQVSRNSTDGRWDDGHSRSNTTVEASSAPERNSWTPLDLELGFNSDLMGAYQYGHVQPGQAY